jgi:hypothetical protein
MVRSKPESAYDWEYLARMAEAESGAGAADADADAGATAAGGGTPEAGATTA